MDVQLAILICLGVLIVLCIGIFLYLVTRRQDSLSIGRSFGHIQEQLTRLSAIHQEIEQISQLFLIPQTRGGVGETLLEELLRNWLPPKAYRFQYSFASGSRVDAVIQLGPYIVPIDAKFPMETVRNWMEQRNTEQAIPASVQKPILKHVHDISEKYIRTHEGTLSFALMYIPSEKLYYLLFAQEDSSLLNESLQRGVVPVGPSGLFLYVQTIAYGLRGFSMQEKQREIVQHLFRLRKEYEAVIDSISLSQTHVKNFINSFDDTRAKLQSFEQTIRRLEASKNPD